ncbi:MAG: hypothetical protein NC548_06105 [Lachnospiraceae bacterium]|nr:hypothetical protein [Lachnospiraceae bacterium]
MKLTIEMDNGQTMVIERNDQLLQQLVARYPEVSMMRAMEECNELAIAISKSIANGKPKKIANLGEEIVDVCEAIMKAITRFDLTIKDLEPWEKEKRKRFDEREKKDENVFRRSDAKQQYWAHSFDPARTWGFTDGPDGYRFIGLANPTDISKLAGDFFRFLGTVRGKLVNEGLSSSILHMPDIRALQKIEDIMSPTSFDPEKAIQTDNPLLDIMHHVAFIRKTTKEKTQHVWEWWNVRLAQVSKNPDGTLDNEEYLKAVDELEIKLKAAMVESSPSETAEKIEDLKSKLEGEV